MVNNPGTVRKNRLVAGKFFYGALAAMIVLFIAGFPKYDANAMCVDLGIFGRYGCDEPPPPPPPPTIKALCDGKKPANAFRFNYACTDVNNLKSGEVVTLEGYNFTPGAKGIVEATVKLPNGAVWGSGSDIIPYPFNRVGIDISGDGRFTAVAKLGWNYSDKPWDLPPGVYTLELKFQKMVAGRVAWEGAKVDLRMAATPSPVKPEPPKPPQPAPPPAPNKPPVKKYLLTLIGFGPGGPAYPGGTNGRYLNMEPPLVKAGTAVQGLAFTGTFKDFPPVIGGTRYDVFVDGNKVRQWQWNERSSLEVQVAISEQESPAYVPGVHTMRIKCANCPIYAYNDGFYVDYDSEFQFEVVPQPPEPSVEIADDPKTLHIGDKLEIKGKNFFPKQKIAGVTFAGESGLKVKFPAENLIIAKPDTTLEGYVVVPPEAYGLLADGTEQGNITAQEFLSGTFEEASPFPPESKKTFTLAASCPATGGAKLTPEKNEIAYSDIRESVKIEAEGFYCRDTHVSEVKIVGSDDPGFFQIYSSEDKFSHTGKAGFTLNMGNNGKVSPAAKEMIFSVSDKHGRGAQAVIKLNQKYALGIDPERAKAGDTVRLISWRGFPNNVRVNVFFDGVRLKSTMLSLDFPEIIIPQTATNGWHFIKIGSFDGLGIEISGPIEIYGGKDKLEPRIQVDPAAALPGNTVMVLGKDWKDGDKKIILTGLDGKEFPLQNIRNICNKTLGGNGCDAGEIRYSITVPADTPAGEYAVMVFGDNQKAAANLRVLSVEKVESDAPKIILNPSAGLPGTVVAVSGGGFAGGAGLFAKFDSEKVAIGNGFGVTADNRGAFTASFSVPLGAKVGKHEVVFTSGVPGGNASAEFVVPGGEAEKEKEQAKETIKEEKEKTEGPGEDKNKEAENKKTEGEKTGGFGETEGKKFGDTESGGFGDMETKKYGEEKTNSYGETEVRGFGGVGIKSYGDVKTKTYGSEATKFYGDVKTQTYGDIETKTYGDIETKAYGDIETKAYGGVETKSYGGVETKTYGDVETKTYGDIKANSYGGVETKSYGDVPAPTYEAPQTAPGECNPDIPTYAQPGCKPRSSLDDNRPAASIFGVFRDFLGRIFSSKKKSEPLKLPSAVGKSASESGAPEPAVGPNQDQVQNSKAETAPVSAAASPKKETVKSTPNPTPRPDLAGSYRCFSYNVSGGGGGNCRLFAPIVLSADGTYSISSESGTYRVEGERIDLSASKLRGPGKLLEGNMQIRFEYDYNGWHHVITYLRENFGAAETDSAKSPVAAKSVEITLRITFPPGDYSADSVNSVTLISKDTNEQIAQALPYPLDRSTIEVWFGKRPPKEGVPVGKVYKIIVGSGFSEWQVGELDLRNVTEDSTTTIQASTQ